MAKEISGRRRLHGGLLTTALGGLIVLAAGASAQPGQQRMMVFDDGDGPQVVHFTGPDLRELRKPDFARKDLPIFNTRLDLDEMQRLVVGVLLEAYLDAFETLSEETLPVPSSPMLGMAMGAPQGEGGEGEGPETLEGIVRDAIKETGGAPGVEIELAGQGPIAIQIEATAAFAGEGGDPDAGLASEDVDIMWAEGGEAGEAGDPEANVYIAVAGPEGVELPPELREKLAQKAQEMAERIRQRLEQIEAEGGPPPEELAGAGSAEERRQYFDELRESTEKFRKAKEALKQDFLNEVRSQLSAEQLELWPGFERALTRIRTLPEGRLDGERTNLLQIVAGLGLDQEQQEAVAEALEAYELQLHEALVARNAFVREAQSKIDKAIEAGRFAGAISTVDRASRLRVAVRGVNEQSTDAIAGRLGSGTAQTFRAEVLRQSYPRVYRPTRGQQAFRGARGLEGIEDEVRSAADELEKAYTTEVEAANERLRQAIHRHQPREARRMIERIRSMLEDGEPMAIDDEEDPAREAMRRRSQLDERYMKQLYALLAPEQVETLPRLPSQIQRGPIIIRSGPPTED